ncbi:MAG TPA: S41 family peptidase [Candidatus Dojkabacteria bacterium]|nr:S41 family peptidase [Candidatus Dojkabacteria bacterium]
MQKKNSFKYVGISILVVITFVFGFISGRYVTSKGWFVPSGSGVINKSNGDTSADFNLFWTVWDDLKGEYVDSNKVTDQNMLYAAIKGLVSSYDDPATLFLNPKETEDFNNSISGKAFQGIGAELGYENNQVIVVAPLSGSPAQKAGLRAGDIIVKVDGIAIKSTDNLSDIVLKIRGKSGTTVTLTIVPKGTNTTKDLTITRGEITVPSIEVKDVKDHPELKIINVSRFTEDSLMKWETNWDNAVAQVLNSNAKGVIIDLRGNPGGYFDAAVYAGGEFLPKGTIVSKQQDRNGNVQDFKVDRKGKMIDMPVVVLVDGSSASASEILAGALQKNNRALIIGENSYGKGTAQSILDLPGGATLHLTTLKWLLPDGSWINHDNTIKPDQVVKYSEEDFKKGIDNQLVKAIQTVLSKIK